MLITIVTEGLTLSGDTIKTKPLGGSETWLICIARELAKLGNQVNVFCNCDKPDEYDGVYYSDVSQYRDFVEYGETDVLIVSRHFSYFGLKANSKLNILFNHDIPALPEQLLSLAWNIDYVYCLSEYHKSLFETAMPELKGHIKLSQNGIDLNLIPDLTKVEKKHKIMFTSRPERGLYQALADYEKLNDKTLEFKFCNYPSLSNEEVQQIETACFAKAKDLVSKGFNVTFGQYSKADLYKEIAEAKAVYYPTEFPEVFCISALEAQACGTAFITVNKFALPEILAYTPTDNAYEDLKDVLSSDEYRKELEEAGIEQSLNYSWEKAAIKMIEDIDNAFDGRDVLKRVDRLVYDSDIVTAEKALESGLVDSPEKLEEVKSMLGYARNPEEYKELYEDEETHEKINLDWNVIKQNTRFNWLADQVKENNNKTLLDYACHMGWSSIILNNETDCKVTGYDISESAIKKATERIEKYCPKKDNIKFTANKKDLEGQVFDAVFVGEYLEHTLDPKAELEKIMSHVKDGGNVYITVPKGAWEFLSREQNIKKGVYYHIQCFDRTDLELMFGSQKDYDCLVISNLTGSYGEKLGNYMVSFTKTNEPIGDKLSEENVFRKLFTAREHQTISACIIAKDAENSIERMLDSLKDSHNNYEPDEILIADDGSKDKTIERAEAKGCKVYKMPKSIVADKWGFANARNFIVNKAKGDWIFWIDTDEECFGLNKIRMYLESPIINAFVIKQHHPQLDNFIEADKPHRIFRKNKGEFVGYIHEQPMSIDDINEPIYPALILNDTKVVNYGFMTEKTRRDKGQGRNLILLKTDVEENVDKRAKQGLPIRKLSIVLLMRDFVNRMHWAYERYKTYNCKDVQELSVPMIEKFYNKYFKEEKDSIYKDYADRYLSQAYELSGQGEKIAINYKGKEIERYIKPEQIESVVNEII